jgi:multiple sugar transport system ATP-binding protein
MTLADRIVVLNEGCTEQIGAPLEVYHRPETLFVAGFIGSPKMNFLPVRLVNVAGGAMTLMYGTDSTITSDAFVAPQTGNGDLTLGIRPEHLTVCEVEPEKLSATVRVVEALGSDTYIYADLPTGEQIVIRAQSDTRVRRGETIGLHIEKGSEQLFEANGRALKRSDSQTSVNVG